MLFWVVVRCVVFAVVLWIVVWILVVALHIVVFDGLFQKECGGVWDLRSGVSLCLLV